MYYVFTDNKKGFASEVIDDSKLGQRLNRRTTNAIQPCLNTAISETVPFPQNTKVLFHSFENMFLFTFLLQESVMGPLEAFLKSLPEHDQQRKKVYAVGKEKRKNVTSPTHSNSSALSLNTPSLWRPPIAPPLSDMADLTLQPSTSSGKEYFIT